MNPDQTIHAIQQTVSCPVAYFAAATAEEFLMQQIKSWYVKRYGY